ncbi:unnamed protein product [Paramecium primaurelia]|uniref:Uncharacterized protein n=1 Tax=Paramecium primaurelia TaxID=5886 RepID=A0A8S1NZH6_PARPR|nr:unnamed protein product [Paramecium primaurelia]
MGAVCIKRQSRCDGNLNYPIINKLMKFQPDKQFPLVKPHNHSDMVEETYEMNYLELILNFQEIPLKKKKLKKNKQKLNKNQRNRFWIKNKQKNV